MDVSEYKSRVLNSELNFSESKSLYELDLLINKWRKMAQEKNGEDYYETDLAFECIKNLCEDELDFISFGYVIADEEKKKEFEKKYQNYKYEQLKGRLLSLEESETLNYERKEIKETAKELCRDYCFNDFDESNYCAKKIKYEKYFNYFIIDSGLGRKVKAIDLSVLLFLDNLFRTRCVDDSLLDKEDKKNYDAFYKVILSLLDNCKTPEGTFNLYNQIVKNNVSGLTDEINEKLRMCFEAEFLLKAKKEFINVHRKEIFEQINLYKNTQDVVGYLIDLQEKYPFLQLNIHCSFYWMKYEDKKEFEAFENEIISFLSKKQREALDGYFGCCREFEKDKMPVLRLHDFFGYFDWSGLWEFIEGLVFGFSYYFGELYSFYRSNEKSIKHKLYERLYKKYKEKQPDTFKILKIKKLVSNILKVLLLIVVILISSAITTCSIDRYKNQDSRLAEKQRIENEKIAFENNRQLELKKKTDVESLEKMAGNKISLEDMLVSVKEPTMYVIAPMSYSIESFNENYSQKDKERTGLLENCITAFQNSVDDITGVSFLDRSKISQIEKEHKFQLGDWSNNKKTAEVGKALNSNILMFLDKFTYVDTGSGEYRFEAKFVDVNTMKSSSFVVVYKNPKKKIVTPEVVSQISFRDFTPVSTKNESFNDELLLKTQKFFRTVQKKDFKTVSPLGSVTCVEPSEYDAYAPKTEFIDAMIISIDGFGTLELKTSTTEKTYSYTFDANEINLMRDKHDFYSDGKIGVLSVKTEKGYEKFDVFTNNNREYYLRLGFVELDKAFVNYYLQMLKN